LNGVEFCNNREQKQLAIQMQSSGKLVQLEPTLQNLKGTIQIARRKCAIQMQSGILQIKMNLTGRRHPVVYLQNEAQ